MDRCHPSPCQNGGRCVDHEEDFHCTCSLGFLGRTCEGKLSVKNGLIYLGRYTFIIEIIFIRIKKLKRAKKN